MRLSQPSWKLLLLGLWLYASVWLLLQNASSILTLLLPDPDDNLRLQQVRDWLAGQGWFVLHQYRLAPPQGADIHWSRIIDLPIAAVILAVRPFFGTSWAEVAAVTIVPLLTLFAAMALMASIARRLIAPDAWFWAAAMLLMASQARSLMMPLRIDHHGWQLVLVLALLFGLISADRRLGGMAAGVAIALSLGIGVEMLPYLMLGIGLAAGRWVIDEREVLRLRSLAATLLVGSLFVLLLFVPPSERLAFRCDAFTKTMALPFGLGSAALIAATLIHPHTWRGRLLLVTASGVSAALFIFGDFGRCMWDPYNAIDEDARRLWLDQVVEAVPLYRQPMGSALASLFLPVAGLAGSAMMLSRSGKDAALRSRWAILATFQLWALMLTIVQTRAMAAAELFAVVGVAALCWIIRDRIVAATGSTLVRAVGTATMFLALSGLIPKLVWVMSLEAPSAVTAQATSDRNCMTSSALRGLDLLPSGISLTLIDAAPALLVHTHHRALAGPYHRNSRIIADVMRAWAGTDARAVTILRRYGVRWVFLCGDPAEGGLYRERSTDGLYARVQRGAPPPWLRPQRLSNTPWRAWQLVQ